MLDLIAHKLILDNTLTGCRVMTVSLLVVHFRLRCLLNSIEQRCLECTSQSRLGPKSPVKKAFHSVILPGSQFYTDDSDDKGPFDFLCKPLAMRRLDSSLPSRGHLQLIRPASSTQDFLTPTDTFITYRRTELGR